VQSVASEKLPSRWLIAGMGTLLQLCLGSVYAWSYFQKPLTEGYGWSNAQVAWTFSLAIGFLGLAAAAGGVALPRFGPRTLAVTGSLLFGAGHLLAAFALHLHSLPLLWLGYGVIGGIGLGLGYVTPVATAAKWFPDKKGLVTGMVVMGFGFGALLMSKVIAPALSAAFADRLPLVFAGAGVILGGAGLAAAWFMRNPPMARPDVGPPLDGGPSPSHTARLQGPALQEPTAPPADWRRFALMWLVFFCNIAAGIAIIGFQSPLLQDLCRQKDSALSATALAGLGATLIAVSSLFNGLGRLLWGALSDRLGQLCTFRVMLGTQVLVFAALIVARDPWLFGGLVCYVLLCYGGGFGVMPAFVLNTFGARRMPVLYGCILTAWSAAGVVGPQVVARLKDHYGAEAAGHAFALGAGLLALGFVLSLLLRDRERTA
jgi:OFA family oxalate/formate antiporter-like MFS transporter